MAIFGDSPFQETRFGNRKLSKTDDYLLRGKKFLMIHLHYPSFPVLLLMRRLDALRLLRVT